MEQVAAPDAADGNPSVESATAESEQTALSFPSVAAFEAWVQERKDAGNFHFVKAQSHKPKKKAKADGAVAEVCATAASEEGGREEGETGPSAEQWLCTVTYKCKHWQKPEKFVSFWKKKQLELQGDAEVRLLGEMRPQSVHQLNRRLKLRREKAAGSSVTDASTSSARDGAFVLPAKRKPRSNVASLEELQTAQREQREEQKRISEHLEKLADPDIQRRIAEIRELRRRRRDGASAKGDETEKTKEGSTRGSSNEEDSASENDESPPDFTATPEVACPAGAESSLVSDDRAEAALGEEGADAAEEREALSLDEGEKENLPLEGRQAENVTGAEPPILDAYSRRRIRRRQLLRAVPHCGCQAFLRFRFFASGKVMLIASDESHSAECMRNRSTPFKLPESILAFILRNKHVPTTTLVRCCANPELSRQLIRDAPPHASTVTEKDVENCLYRARQREQLRKSDTRSDVLSSQPATSNGHQKTPNSEQTLPPSKRTKLDQQAELYRQLETQLHEREVVLRERACLSKKLSPKRRQRERNLELLLELHALEEALQAGDLPARDRAQMKRREETIRKELQEQRRRAKQEAARNARALSRQRRRLLESDLTEEGTSTQKRV